MRILFVHSVADTYGASRSLLRLTSRLATDGHTILVLLPAIGPLSTLLKEAGVSVAYLPRLAIIKREQLGYVRNLMKMAVCLPASIVSLFGIVRTFRPDCIHTNTSLILTPAFAAKLLRIPHIWHIREIFSDFPRLWVFYQWLLYLFSDSIICVSEAVAGQFHTFIRMRRIEVIHNGFPKSEFAAVEETRIRRFRDQFDLNGHLAIGLVGRIKLGRKGQDVFVKAAAMLKDRFPGVRFLCIGSPFQGNESHLIVLMKMIRDLDLGGSVIYTGDVPDIKAAYASLSISVVPSELPESFSGVVIESMAMGKPVIGTACGGTVEQIEDGATGFLVPAGDAEALAARLRELLSDKEFMSQAGKRGRERFLDKFEFAVFYNKMLTLYLRFVSAKSDGRK